MPTVDFIREEILPLAYSHRRNNVICMLGQPGIGKTSIVYDFAREKGVKVVELVLSQCLPSELSGMKMPDAESRTMQVYDSELLMSLEDGDILFLDELLQAPESVQKAAMKLVCERRLESGKLLPDVMIIAAANPDKKACQFIPAFRNRFSFVNAEADYASVMNEIERRYGWRPMPSFGEAVVKTDWYRECWNVMSPRKIFGLLDIVEEWAESNVCLESCVFDIGMKNMVEAIWPQYEGDTRGREVYLNIRSGMFQFGRSIYDRANRKRKDEEAKRLIIEIAKKHGIEVAASICTIDDLVRYLEGIPEWEDICKDAESIYLKKGE